MKRISIVRKCYRIGKVIVCNFGISNINKISWFTRDYFTLKSIPNPNFLTVKLSPQIHDRTIFTPLDPVYFYQDTWAAKKIFELKPTLHYDVGSSATTMGIISQFIPVIIVDIRPLRLHLENLHFIKGSIYSLPFPDNSIESLSSLCVVEHIGLGRYGDGIDSFGSEKAIAELKRVVRVGGNILISVPVDNKNIIYFNAHRAFTRDYILKLFDDFVLIEEMYQYGELLKDKYNETGGFGTGMFLFRKGG